MRELWDFKKDGNNYAISTQNAEQNLMLAGEPMSWEKLVSDIEQSERDYKMGNFSTSNELLDKIENW